MPRVVTAGLPTRMPPLKALFGLLLRAHSVGPSLGGPALVIFPRAELKDSARPIWIYCFNFEIELCSKRVKFFRRFRFGTFADNFAF